MQRHRCDVCVTLWLVFQLDLFEVWQNSRQMKTSGSTHVITWLAGKVVAISSKLRTSHFMWWVRGSGVKSPTPGLASDIRIIAKIFGNIWPSYDRAIGQIASVTITNLTLTTYWLLKSFRSNRESCFGHIAFTETSRFPRKLYAIQSYLF